MIAGVVAVVDVGDVRPVWHLLDVGGWPLVTFCGEQAPEPMRRRVRPVRRVDVDASWCSTCSARAGKVAS